MNLRRRMPGQPIQLPLAPMIDVIMFLLCFFLVTWNIARDEQDISVKVPTAKNGQNSDLRPGEVIINVTQDGKIVIEHETVTLDKLQQKLQDLVKIDPDEVVILRGAELASWNNIIPVLDVCRAANLNNVAFAVNRTTASQTPDKK